jgi:hypothetical protein
MIDYIDSNNFNIYFDEILNKKPVKNVVDGRYNLEPIGILEKSKFVIKFLESIKEITGITYKLLFWENDKVIKDLVTPFNRFIDSKISKSYQNTEVPGVAFIENKQFNEIFMKTLLDNHFNFEMAVTPSLNLRIQICINNTAGFIYLLDIYDDRGFDIYHLYL